MCADRPLSRRKFLATSAAGAAAVAASPALSRGQRANANDRIAVAVIGCGKMANDYHIPELLHQPDVQVVAVCEVDATRRAAAAKRVDEHYAVAKAAFHGCEQIVDFREILGRDAVDAVCIATPDHWHAIQLIEACKAGKDVYCEKPLTLTLAESQRCIEAARQHRRIVQTGSQQRSNVFGPFREAVAILQSGRLGKIHKVTVGVGAPSVPCDLPEEPLEPGLDWDLWLGQAPMRPYNSILSPRGVHNHFPAWRSYREYSGGLHTDMGAHHYDIAQWALGMDGSGPVKITPPDDEQATSGVTFTYDNGVEMVHGGPSGCVFYGEHGTLHIDRGVLASEPASIVADALASDELKLPDPLGHHRDWLDAIKSRKPPTADVEKGARTAAVIHLGNLPYWERRAFAWNPQTWTFADAADNKFLDRPRRAPWQLPSAS